MTRPQDIHPIVIKVLEELSERYSIHKRPTIKKSDNLELGWGVLVQRKKPDVNGARKVRRLVLGGAAVEKCSTSKLKRECCAIWNDEQIYAVASPSTESSIGRSC